ncbi:hypothetical protein [Novosphingobium sp.]|uniref:hypothetical protein n=1 Tax=Novosphingobium sp. TaxID=1874826 RepID=UPI002FDD84A4
MEATLVALNHISEEKRVAFRARLKHFQRLGFPQGANTGTGKRAVYSAKMFIQLCFAIEFSQMGMTPSRIVQILNDNWDECEASLLFAITPEQATSYWSDDIPLSDLAWIFSPEALRDLTLEGEGKFDYKEYISVLPIDKIPSIMKEEINYSPVVGEIHRHFIIHLRPFLIRAMELLKYVRPEFDHMSVFKSLEASVVARQADLKRFMDHMDGFAKR